MESLGLDWKLLIAQVINFGILLFLLKKILYKPLMKAIDDRNKKISGAVENSQKIEEKLKEIEEKEVRMLEKAREKAKKEREELLTLAETEKSQLLAQAKESAKKEIEKGIESIKAAEEEAVKKLSDKFMSDLVNELGQKMAKDSKSKKFPVIKKLVK